MDTEQIFFEATRVALDLAGSTLSPDQWARWYLAEGRRSREIAALVGVPPSSITATIKKRDEIFWSRVNHGVPLLPGVRRTLEHLSDHFSLAVVTGASRRHFDRVHAVNQLDAFIDIVVTSDDYELNKPHPQSYQTALRRLGLGPSDCLAVEDSPRGAVAAMSAGIRCCIIPTRMTNLALCPSGCSILSNVTQLIQITHRERRAS